MKLNTNIPEHLEQIAKFITGEMNPSEAKNFEELINLDEQNITLINRMKNDWNRIGSMNYNKPDTTSAWSKLHQKLNEENLIPSSHETPIHKLSWVNWAAAVVAIFVVSSAFLFSGILSKDIIIASSSDPSTVVHILADESTVYLKPNSELRYTKKFGKKNRSVSLTGEAFFDVTRNENLPFQIDTHNAMVEVLGTSFTVKSYEQNNFELIVETGKVSVSTKEENKQALTVFAGEAASLINKKLAKSVAIEDSYQNLLTQRLHFKDETLSDIIRVVNKNYNANIILNFQDTNNKRLTVTFYNNSLSSIVEVICATVGLEATFVDNTIILFKP
jgi:ferric-dicitrate binding protein FerR (iron transport regulator)